MSDGTHRRPGAKVPAWQSYLSDVNAGVRRTVNDAWMITFTDLVALMLTFFVLLFSMSTVERYKWQNLVRSLAGGMDSIQAREGAKPAVEFQIDQEEPTPGTDLDYLTPVVAQWLAAEPALSTGIVWRAVGRTVFSLPAVALFSDGESAITERANAAVYAISRLVQSLDNLVEIHGHTVREGGREPELRGWDTSLARASALAEALAAAGYRGNIVARGYGASRQGGFTVPGSDNAPDKLRSRIDIVILEVAPNGT